MRPTRQTIAAVRSKGRRCCWSRTADDRRDRVHASHHRRRWNLGRAHRHRGSRAARRHFGRHRAGGLLTGAAALRRESPNGGLGGENVSGDARSVARKSNACSRASTRIPHSILGAHPATLNGRARRDRARRSRFGATRRRMCASATARARAADAPRPRPIGSVRGLRRRAPCCRSTIACASTTPTAATWERRDPYRFLPTLGDVDLHLFNEGTHRELWKKLGAHVRDGGRHSRRELRRVGAERAPRERRRRLLSVGRSQLPDAHARQLRRVGAVRSRRANPVRSTSTRSSRAKSRFASRPTRTPRRWSSFRAPRPSSKARARIVGATTHG